jgi:hypothetical protein
MNLPILMMSPLVNTSTPTTLKNQSELDMQAELTELTPTSNRLMYSRDSECTTTILQPLVLPTMLQLQILPLHQHSLLEENKQNFLALKVLMLFLIATHGSSHTTQETMLIPGPNTKYLMSLPISTTSLLVNTNILTTPWSLSELEWQAELTVLMPMRT